MNFAGERYHFPENIIVNDASSVVQEITYKFQTEVIDMMSRSATVKKKKNTGQQSMIMNLEYL